MAEQLINQTDAQGRKQGYWEETGKWSDTEKGHYVDGLRQGLWKGYRSKNGKLRWESHYLNDIPHGLEKQYREDGVTLSSEGPYLNGNQHGHWKWYQQDGVTLSMEGHWLNGKAHGIWKDYYRDGVLWKERHYLNDALMSQKEYDIDGITLESEYDGVFMFSYNEDGTISRAFYQIQHEDEDGEGGGVETKYLTEEEIGVYNKIISSVGREAWRAIPRELFDYLHYIQIL